MTAPTEWWGPSERDIESDGYVRDAVPAGRVPPVIKRKITQRDGTSIQTDVTPTIDEYYERLTRPPRKRKRTKSAEIERTTKVPEIVELWDELRRDPYEPLGRIRRVPPDWVASPDEIITDHPIDFRTAQEVRRLRAPVLLTDGEHCISAIFGCELPVKYKTPELSCDRCWKFHKRHDRWPDLNDIQRRRARELKKSRGNP